jgi:hypothetical protein
MVQGPRESRNICQYCRLALRASGDCGVTPDTGIVNNILPAPSAMLS